jgi:hypothetical protein
MSMIIRDADDSYADQILDKTQASMDLQTEAERRLSKANLYQQILDGQLFEGEDPVALEVEEEFRAFAEERLAILLGIKLDKKTAEAVSEFAPEEVEALKRLAARMLGRNVAIAKPAEAQLAAPRVMAPTPASSLAAPAPVRRGRGRPPGTGKHQIAAKKAAEVTAPTSTPQLALPAPDPVVKTEKMKVTLPDGREVETTVQKGQVRPPDPKRKPMPSPDEAVAFLAMQNEEIVNKAAASMPGALNAVMAKE